MNNREALTQLEIMATNATGRLGEAKVEERALLNKHIEALDMAMDALKDYKPKTGHWIEDDEQIHVEKTYHCKVTSPSLKRTPPPFFWKRPTMWK